MKKSRLIASGLIFTMAVVTLIPVNAVTSKAAGATPVYRLYNPTNGDHMYTSSKEEYDIAIQGVYEGEGQIYTASGTGDSIHRLYNAATGEHFYTASKKESDACVKAGWAYEGVSFITQGDTKVYRLFSPGALHVFTSDNNEIKVLTGLGWTNEGVAWTATKSNGNGFTGMPNPIVKCSSMEEMNKKAQTSIVRPGVMGVTDEKYEIINSDSYVIAQYSFSLNGTPFTLRSANTTEDISGYYVSGGTAFANTGNESISYYSDSSAKLARWITIDGQFVLMAKDDGKISQDRFAGLAEELRLTITPTVGPAVPYAELAGEYQDSYSQRASLKAEDVGEALKITILWGNSASSTEQWKMTAKFAEDGLLVYDDCVCSTIATDSTGAQRTLIKYSNGSGYFSVSEGRILWNGAQDENCRECVFEKMP